MTDDPLLPAWQEFTATGHCDEQLVAPPVLRSWQRCLTARVDPHGPPSAPLATSLSAAQTELAALVRASMEQLYQFVEGAGCAVLLADRDATLIELIADPPTREQVAALGGLGAPWHERQIGTLALNLALHEARPCQTRGAEHFRACNHPLACAAAPLFDLAGQTIGALGVLSTHDAAHPHTLGMVIAAAQAIHAQLRANLLLAEANAHLAELNTVIEAMSEGLIFLDSQGNLSKINSRASQMLGLTPRAAAGRPLDGLLDLPTALRPVLEQRRELTDQELVFMGRKGAVAALCSVRPVWDRSRRYLGALITLRSPETVQRLVQRVVGAQARFTFTDIVGESPAIQAVIRQARIAANTQSPILLVGEPGVGKELCAHAIHNGGLRAGGPFVVLNCATVPRTLILGELLGYEGDGRDGASSRPGKLELAIGGTLLLEEVSELSLEAQTCLLRAIETQNLVRTGGRRVIRLDVRIIASSLRDLRHEVAEGRFRADLFYRLGVLNIAIPPLRERGDDLLMLIDQLLAATNRRMGKQCLLAPDALAALLAYPWPGNVRELETTLERLLQLAEHSVLTLADLPPVIARTARASGLAAPTPTLRLYDRHAAAERDAILRAGRETAGHLGQAAQRLGISRATLWRKMKLYGISKEHFW